MKTSKPIILLVLALVVIGIGVYGIMSTRAAEESRAVESEEITGIAAPGAMDLLDVRNSAALRSQIKDYEGFRVSFNAENHTPNWVSWELLDPETTGEWPRGKFWHDEEVEGCAQDWDYRNSGYDRGHMCPSADQKWSETAMRDCFSFANMVPQDHYLNNGAWKTLENKERTWAQRDSAIVIVAGPIYEKGDTMRIGDTGVRVPSAFFKVIAAPYLAEPRAIAFVYPNMTAPGNMENYVTTVDEVEKLTGFDFFHALPDDVENRIESVSSFRDWNRRK